MDYTFILLLFTVAVLYSGVGHGGASGYLALMAIWGFNPELMKPWALLLNVFVSLIAALQFLRTEKPDLKLLLLLIAGSIPAAFLGASIIIEIYLYKKLIGIIILFQSLRLLSIMLPVNAYETPQSYGLKGPIAAGAGIGLLSGMIGIGGGIILSPLLLHLRWSHLKQTALLSAAFIFANSVSGLAATGLENIKSDDTLWWALASAIAGGLTGGWLGSFHLNFKALKILLGLVMLIAGLKLLIA